MQITVNGQGHDLPDHATVAGLVADLGLAGRRVAVERNREIVRRDTWDDTLLAPGDQVEILHFVGGG